MPLHRFHPTLPPFIFIFALLVLCFAAPALAKKKNVTVDDQVGDEIPGVRLIYTPSDKWKYGPDCKDCLARPDPRRAYGLSWHDATVARADLSMGYNDVRNMVLTFRGSAIYIYCIIPNYVPDATTNVYLAFAIDGQEVGRYNHTPSASAEYEYDVLVYRNENLSDDQHQFVLTPTGGPTNESLVLFDYAIFTHDPGSKNPGAIAGGIGGGVGALLLVALLVFFCPRRQRAARHARYLARDKSDVIDAEDVADPAFFPEPFLVPETAPEAQFGLSHLRSHAAELLHARHSPATRVTSPDYRYDALASDPPDGESLQPSSIPPPGAIGGSEKLPKSVMRQAALERQLLEVQRRIEALPPPSSSDAGGNGGLSSEGGPGVYVPTSTGAGVGTREVENGVDAAALRAQVEALQAEVERLRAENAGMELYGVEAPPAYDGRRQEREAGGGGPASDAQPQSSKVARLAAQNPSNGEFER